MLDRKLVTDALGRTDVESVRDLVTRRIERQRKLLVGSPVDNTLLIEDLEDSSGRLVNQIEHILVVWEWNELPQDTLPLVLLLLQLENESVELLGRKKDVSVEKRHTIKSEPTYLLQRFICVINAELVAI